MGHGGKKRGTAAHKKRGRMNRMQRLIRAGTYGSNLAAEAGNLHMTCDSCGELQKNRAFCYFCSAVQRVPQCGECGRIKCVGTDCMVPHVGRHVGGMSFVGAICDFCEAWVCHSRRCLDTHACRCPLQGAHCIECDRGVWNHGGRIFTCASCSCWICEDDQAEHQATCQVMDAETDHCISCNRIGCWSCLKCKICFCDQHVKSKVQPDRKKDEAWRCKRCMYDLQETKLLSVSTKKHEYGRQTRDAGASSYYGRGQGDGEGGGMGGLSLNDDDEDDEDDDDDDDDSYSSGSEDEDEDSEGAAADKEGKDAAAKAAT